MVNLVSGKDLKEYNYAPSWKKISVYNSKFISVPASSSYTYVITNNSENKERILIFSNIHAINGGYDRANINSTNFSDLSKRLYTFYVNDTVQNLQEYFIVILNPFDSIYGEVKNVSSTNSLYLYLNYQIEEI